MSGNTTSGRAKETWRELEKQPDKQTTTVTQVTVVYQYKINFTETNGNAVTGVKYSITHGDKTDTFVNDERIEIFYTGSPSATIKILSVPEGYVMPAKTEYDIILNADTYELNIELSGFNLGDVDENGIVDASDASAVLAAYAAVQTGGNTPLTAKQIKAADVDNNGTVDASDASTILAYYAYKQTSGTKSFTDYIKG